MTVPTQTVPRRTPASPPAPAIPPLHPGDHLTAEEFMRRYEAMPEIKKAELIQGVVYMPSPVTQDEHGGPHVQMIAWLGTYWAYTPGVEAGDNSTLRMGPEDVPQADGFLRILPTFGGQSSTVAKYVTGAPELIGEIAASSAAYDLHEKKETYRRHRVQEYVVWRVWDRAIDWFLLGGEADQRLPLADGLYKSRTFPGLWLDGDALLRGDMAKVLEVLHQGLASPEHAEFVRRLAETKNA